MNDRVIRKIETLRNIRNFGAVHAVAFAVGSLARDLFTVVNTALDELEDAGAAQSAAGGTARQGTASKDAARKKLREALEIISRTARAMAFSLTGLDDKFRLPRKASDQVLLNTARAFFAEATPLKAEFIKHEMPADFLEDLSARIDAFERARLEQSAGNKARVSARAIIDAAVERGMEAVRQLDPLVRNKFRDDPATLAAWESARHVERAPRTRQGQNQNNPAPPAQ